MTFLRTAHQQGVDAIAMLVELARAPDPGIVAGLTLRSGCTSNCKSPFAG